MKTLFIPEWESTTVIEHEWAQTLEYAEFIAPWACTIEEVDSGWLAFESWEDHKIWLNTH